MLCAKLYAHLAFVVLPPLGLRLRHSSHPGSNDNVLSAELPALVESAATDIPCFSRMYIVRVGTLLAQPGRSTKTLPRVSQQTDTAAGILLGCYSDRTPKRLQAPAHNANVLAADCSMTHTHISTCRAYGRTHAHAHAHALNPAMLGNLYAGP